MSTDTPSMHLLIALVPFVWLLDEMEPEKLEPMLAESLKDNEHITGEDLANAIEIGQLHLVPLRKALKEKTVAELRSMVKDDFGISGHSKTKEKDLIEVLLLLDLEERQRLASLSKEEAEKTAGARELVKEASEAAKAENATQPDEPDTETPAPAPAPKPAPKTRKKKMPAKPPRVRDVLSIEVLEQFFAPTKVKKGKQTIPSAAPIAKSIYRDRMAQHVYKLALDRDKAETAKGRPGFLARHIKVLAVEKD